MSGHRRPQKFFQGGTQFKECTVKVWWRRNKIKYNPEERKNTI